MAAVTGLQALLAIVEADIREHVPNVTFVYGEGELAKHGKPPRVSWVPAEGSFGPYTPSDFQGDNPPPIYLDKAALVVHCWADPDELQRDSLAEALGHQAIASIRRVCGRWHELQGNTRDKNANPSARGWLYIFAVTIHIPILDDEWDTATLTATPFDTTETPPDGVLQAPGDD